MFEVPSPARSYLAVLLPVANGFSAFSPDLPGLVSSGKDEATVRLHLSEALALHLHLLGKDDPLPAPKTRHVGNLGEGQQSVLVEPAPFNPVSLALSDLFRSTGRTLTDLALEFGMKRPALSRLQDPFYWGHTLATLRTIAEHLDRTVEVSFKAAD